jgi:hypothetical protein
VDGLHPYPGSNLSAGTPLHAMRSLLLPELASSPTWGDVVRSMVLESGVWWLHPLHGRGHRSPGVDGCQCWGSLGGQQRGSSSNRTRPHETPRVTTTASVRWLVMRGFVVDGLPGFLDGMQGVRGSSPLSSTTTTAQVTGLPSLSATLPAAAGLSDSWPPRATRCWRRSRCQGRGGLEQLIQGGRDGGVPASQHVLVAQGGRRGGVPHPGHQLPGAGPGGDRQGGRGVPQVVKARPRQAGGSGGRPPHPPLEVAAAQQPTLGGGNTSPSGPGWL